MLSSFIWFYYLLFDVLLGFLFYFILFYFCARLPLLTPNSLTPSYTHLPLFKILVKNLGQFSHIYQTRLQNQLLDANFTNSYVFGRNFNQNQPRGNEITNLD
jgi:hypothetical protein